MSYVATFFVGILVASFFWYQYVKVNLKEIRDLYDESIERIKKICDEHEAESLSLYIKLAGYSAWHCQLLRNAGIEHEKFDDYLKRFDKANKPQVERMEDENS
jgi:hypothetical protein